MKIEKLTENKIRIIINSEDLKKNNIDSNNFMKNPIESQKLFLEMLLTAEKEVGFNTEGCKLIVEALSSSEGIFIFTITKYIDKNLSPSNKIKFNTKKKELVLNTNSSTSIYQFQNFKEFCDFCTHISYIKKINFKQLAKSITLYLYNDSYYLVLSKINVSYKYIKIFYTAISEFATLVSHSDILETKLLEHGKLIIKRNAIENGIKYLV